MGGSGGSGSGQIGYPAYIELLHSDWLQGFGVVPNMQDTMQAAMGASPFAAAVPYDPDADIATYIAAVGNLDIVIGSFIGTTDLIMNPVSMPVVSVTPPTVSVTIPSKITEAAITTDTAKLEAQLDALKMARLTGDVIPRFEAGMRDINATVSSAFVIGRAMIESDADAEVTRDTASHGSKLRIAVSPTAVEVAEIEVKKSQLSIQASDIEVKESQLNIQAADSDLKESHLDLQNRDFVFRVQQARVEFERMLAQLTLEANRIKIVAKKEEMDDIIEYDVADAKWDLEVFTYGGNLLAAPGGGVSIPTGTRNNKAASAIGGALSGAAMGAAAGLMGGPLSPITSTGGAIIGGLLGLGAGLMG